LAQGTLIDPAAPSGPTETLLEFPDNRLLVDLCGEFDRNLTRVETALEVQIIRRGNQLAVIGEAGSVDRAASVLQSLYQRLEAGREIEDGDIDVQE